MNEFSQNMHDLSSQHHISTHTVQRTFQAVQKNQQSMSKLFQGTTLALAAVAITALLYKTIPFDYYLSDYRTTTGQMQSYYLSDGTKVTLGAKSAIKLHYTDDKRQVSLVSGEIYVDVAKDTQRPFIIQTQQANFKALGTRFIVDQSDDQSSITMLHSNVQVSALSEIEQSKVITMGEQVVVNQQGIQAVHVVNPQFVEQAWQQQLLIADNLPLSEILQKLKKYHGSYIIYDQEKLSHVKINGIINTKQDLKLTLKLITTQYPEVAFIQLGPFVTYAKMQ